MIKYITLNDGQEVKLNTSITLNAFLKAQEQGYFTKNILSAMMGIVTKSGNPSDALGGLTDTDILNSPYMAYLNANPNGMSKEEFDSNIPIDMELCFEIIGEILSGNVKSKPQLAQNFQKSTKNTGKSKKKYQNSK
ncbi:hypothetical protein [Metaclostridioides mangenotii]|uniref:hypothetical protein n=1 Tax=Metaclostridioides mangenotii TaxID=1540 RepID=UPI000464049C|nr:hypothetical protein [Clostridioides mangenotii]